MLYYIFMLEQEILDQNKNIKFSRVFFHYWKFAKKYKWQYLIMTIFFMVASILFTTIIPLYYRDIIDALNSGQEYSEVISIFTSIIIIIIIYNILFRLADFLMATYQSKNITEISQSIFNQVSQYSLSFFENNFVGSLVNKMNKFTWAFVFIMDTFIFNIFWTIGQSMVVLFILSFINIKITIIFLLWLVVYLVINFWFVKKMLKLDYKNAQAGSNESGALSDILTNVLNIKIFPFQRIERKYYQKFVNNTAQTRINSWMFMNKQFLVNAILFTFLEIVVMLTVIKLKLAGEITIGDVVLVQIYVALYFTALWNISRVLKKLIQEFSNAKEMVQILDHKTEVQDVKNAQKIKIKTGEIMFQEATFSYPNQKEIIFNKFNLKIPAGQKVGLVGTSGAGKTTITKLILRFSNLNSGKILIDNQDVSQITQESLRENIAYVPQEPILFHRSIYENIAYARPNASKKDIMEASKKAYADNFIKTLENGYETTVGERGVKLSGGQKQRIALARAFLKDTPILILDEATSALDSVSEELIQNALFKLMQDKTVIVVAHRLSTIKKMDRILVIEEGEIEEDGTHQELIKQSGQYQKFWKKQTAKFV